MNKVRVMKLLFPLYLLGHGFYHMSILIVTAGVAYNACHAQL